MFAFKIRHTEGAEVKMRDLEEAFQNLLPGIEKMHGAFNRMAGEVVTAGAERQFFMDLLKIKPEDIKDHPRSAGMLEDMEHAYRHGRGASMTIGTRWGLFNAVTEIVTHGRPGTRKSDEKLEVSAMEGSGMALTTRAFEMLTN